VFIKGGGRGGQKINKTNSKVQLKHIPTGIVVECQASRSREENRKRARELLALQVEKLMVPEGRSRLDIVAAYKQNKARKKKQRARKKYLALAEEKRTTSSSLGESSKDP
jgi:protein subunit release factor B